MARKSGAFEFEKSLQELEQLVERLEAGDLSLEDALRCFERGIALTRACEEALREAEQKVKILSEKEAQGAFERDAGGVVDESGDVVDE